MGNPECKIVNLKPEDEIDYENPGSTKKIKQWSPMTNRSWVFHHISAKQIECMWNRDLDNEYYDREHLYAKKLIREGFPSQCECVPPRKEEPEVVAGGEDVIDVSSGKEPIIVQDENGVQYE